MNRRLMLKGVAYALGSTPNEVRSMVLSGELPAWVYRDEGGIERYHKKSKSRYSLIFVKESALKHVNNPLPEPTEELPTGELLLRHGAAAFLGTSTHLIRKQVERGTLPAYVYDQWGVNLIRLTSDTAQRGQVLHFRKADLEAYRERIEQYKSKPHTKRASLPLDEQQKEKIITLANSQMRERGYVAMHPIRTTLKIPPNTYDEALRKLREEHGWPMSHQQEQVSRARAKTI